MCAKQKEKNIWDLNSNVKVLETFRTYSCIGKKYAYVA